MRLVRPQAIAATPTAKADALVYISAREVTLFIEE
jgi:hypothetical protein